MFDPYHKWLGIPPKDQPPNHYRLLGIELFETDADVIAAAANKQMAYVQGCATGPHIALSQKMLNEIAAARLCLLTPAKKADYDAKLKVSSPKSSIPLAKPISAASPVGAITATSPAPASPKSSRKDRDSFDALANDSVGILKRQKHRSKMWFVLLGGVFLGIIGLVVVAVYAIGILNPSKTEKRQAELPGKKTPDQIKEKSQKQDGGKPAPEKKTPPAKAEKSKQDAPSPIAAWDFTKGLNDLIGPLNVTLNGDVKRTDSGLECPGTTGPFRERGDTNLERW